MAGYHDDLARQVARRDAALTAMKTAFENAGSSVKKEVEQLGNGLKIDNVIAEHPWVAAGVALGAGLIVSKLLSSSSSPATVAASPHIIVEVRNNGAEVTTKDVPPPRRSPMDFIAQAVAGFEMVQGLLKQFQNAKRAHAETPPSAEAADAPAAPETPPEAAMPPLQN